MNCFQSLLMQLASAKSLPELECSADFLDGEPPEWFDVKDLSTHAEIWEEAQAMEATTFSFRDNAKSDTTIGRVMVLPYEKEDMIGDWAIGLNETFEYIIDKVVLA